MKKVFLNPLKKIFVSFFLSIFIFGAFPTMSQAEVFSDVPTGLMELDGLKYPVLLYVPDQYDPENPFPMVISLSWGEQSLEAHMDEWKGTADRRNLIVMVPTLLLPRDGSVPLSVNKWILAVKSQVQNRYRVAKTRTYLVGHGDAAHYAAYLGSVHGDEFGGIGLVNGGWERSLKKVTSPQSNAEDQPPFFISFDSDHEAEMEVAKVEAAKYTQKGYILHLEMIDSDEKYSSGKFKRRMLDWFEKNVEKWKAMKASEEKNLKKKLKKWFERNIKVD